MKFVQSVKIRGSKQNEFPLSEPLILTDLANYTERAAGPSDQQPYLWLPFHPLSSVIQTKKARSVPSAESATICGSKERKVQIIKKRSYNTSALRPRDEEHHPGHPGHPTRPPKESNPGTDKGYAKNLLPDTENTENTVAAPGIPPKIVMEIDTKAVMDDIKRPALSHSSLPASPSLSL